MLASGWGDTYAQFRAGQSFDLEGLPNGTYYIAVDRQPARTGWSRRRPTTTSSLRKVIIGGSPAHRTVTVPQVGVIEDS